MARIAKSLDVLRSQINAAYPNRSKLSDGWIGDPAHASRASDHNPNGSDVVTALDITHDPAHGVDTWAMAETLRLRRDPRIKYVISNGRIFSSTASQWQWRPYTGANKHAHHVHVSVLGNPAIYDSGQAWDLTPPDRASVPPIVRPPMGINATLRRRMAKAILDDEARRESGHLAVYRLPSNDGGGAYEVAGINVRYHPDQAAKLKAMIEAGQYDKAEESAIDYLLNYTKAAAGWTTSAGVEYFLRDTIFNRGPTGAARILQRALGVADDGEIGPTTRGAMTAIRPTDLLTKLRAAREGYEREVVGYRANFWNGLVNRWDKVLARARAFEQEQMAVVPPAAKQVATGLGVIAALAAAVDWLGAHPIITAALAAVAVAVVIAVVHHLRTKQ